MTDLAPDQDPTLGREPGARAADLSQRQYACLVRAGEGMSSKEIGRLLGISPSTVDNHIHAAITKLNARNRWHAAQLLHPNRRENDIAPPPRYGPLPPIGGRPNRATIRQRLTLIATIAAIALIALTSTYVVIIGAIAVFGSD